MADEDAREPPGAHAVSRRRRPPWLGPHVVVLSVFWAFLAAMVALEQQPRDGLQLDFSPQLCLLGAVFTVLSTVGARLLGRSRKRARVALYLVSALLAVPLTILFVNVPDLLVRWGIVPSR